MENVILDPIEEQYARIQASKKSETQKRKVEYDVKKLLAVNSEYKGITYKDPEAFLRIVSNRKNDNKVEVDRVTIDEDFLIGEVVDALEAVYNALDEEAN